MGWDVEGKVKGKLDLLVPGPGWTLSGDGGAGLLRPCRCLALSGLNSLVLRKLEAPPLAFLVASLT